MGTKNIILACFIISIAFIETGCKKGEEDPALSLKSRKARISGEWKLVSGEMSLSYADTTVTWTYAGTKMKVKFNGQFLGDYSSFETLAIEKTGKYSQSKTEDDDVYTWEGNWYFGGSNKDLGLKNKETITFVYSERSTPSNRYSFAGLNSNYIYYIKRLTDKELILEMEYSCYGSAGIAETITEYWEYEKSDN